ncbi:restriction endonuclease subunit S [Bacillus altitudinis]|uniref:restriction endonuclease subunit S n=1 Tax=Bacillus altitudinis TaxID=293387 RepID=UPI0022DCEBD5|nr:restriction endonuclease subunit S [Bacillus altitudinis]WBL53097.1 restriction endonuclease subunit S [Bacillus altitudinis]
MSKRKKTVNELLEEAKLSEEEQPYEVPQNWLWITFGTVAKLFNGYAFKSSDYQEEGIPIIRISDISGENTSSKNAVRVPPHLYNEKFLIKKGDLLIAMSGATTGKTGVYNSEELALQNQRVGKIKEISHKVLYSLFMKYFVFYNSKQILKRAYGGAQPNISGSLIEQLNIALPPLEEQKRIADKVEHLLSKIEEAKQLIEEAKETFELRRAAILEKAFRGELTKKWRGENLKESSDTEVVQTDKTLYNLPFNWEWIDLDTVCEKITDGTHHSPKSYPSGDYMYITAKNIKKQGILLDNVTYVSKEVHQEIYNRCDVKKGDVLYIKDGATTGIATVNQITEEFSLLSSVALLRPKRNVLAAKYLMYCLNSPSTKSRMLGMISGNAITRLTLKKIKQGIIPLPPFDEQEIIVSILEKVNSVDEQLDCVTNLEDNINNLKQSILSKAFRGELGTNDPSEESAIELLKEVLQDQVK